MPEPCGGAGETSLRAHQNSREAKDEGDAIQLEGNKQGALLRDLQAQITRSPSPALRNLLLLPFPPFHHSLPRDWILSL